MQSGADKCTEFVICILGAVKNVLASPQQIAKVVHFEWVWETRMGHAIPPQDIVPGDL